MYLKDKCPLDEPHSGIVVIEDFDQWDLWYATKCVPLDLLPKYDYYQNLGIVVKGNGCKTHAVVKGDSIVPLQLYHPQGIKAKNSEQTFALNLLWDDSVPLVILAGAAGSGKTLLSTAHGIEQVFERKKYQKLIIAKSMTPVGREIGFLKGDLDEKVTPWMGSFFDNMLQLGWARADIMDYVMKGDSIELLPLTFIQGRSITDSIIIVDEAQNLDGASIKQIVTRVGVGSKLILLGDPTQIFEDFSEEDSGLTTLLNKAPNTNLIGHVSMSKTVRSDLASWAVKNL